MDIMSTLTLTVPYKAPLYGYTTEDGNVRIVGHQADNFDFAISRDSAVLLLSLMKRGYVFPFSVMCKEYGEDSDWVGMDGEDLDYIGTNPDGFNNRPPIWTSSADWALGDEYQTFELWMDNGDYNIQPVEFTTEWTSYTEASRPVGGL